MIPKIIHYCWFGRGTKSAIIEMCIDSWKQYCPDYEIKEWNEDNSPMTNPWIREACKYKKYAFAADYMRFFVLYNEGGIYMDTDMLLVKGLDCFLNNCFFSGREDEYNVNFAIVGSERGMAICKTCIDYYDSLSFDLVHPPIITLLLKPLFQKIGLSCEDQTEYLSDGVVVYQSVFFYPIHYSQSFEMENVLNYVKEQTYSIHLWNKSWSDEFQLLEAGDWRSGFAEAGKRIRSTPLLPFSYWKKLIKYFGRYLGLWKR